MVTQVERSLQQNGRYLHAMKTSTVSVMEHNGRYLHAMKTSTVSVMEQNGRYLHAMKTSTVSVMEQNGPLQLSQQSRKERMALRRKQPQPMIQRTCTDSQFSPNSPAQQFIEGCVHASRRSIKLSTVNIHVVHVHSHGLKRCATELRYDMSTYIYTCT